MTVASSPSEFIASRSVSRDDSGFAQHSINAAAPLSPMRLASNANELKEQEHFVSLSAKSTLDNASAPASPTRCPDKFNAVSDVPCNASLSAKQPSFDTKFDRGLNSGSSVGRPQFSGEK